MSTSHPCNLRVNKISGVIVPDHNVQTKFKAQAGFLKNSMILYPSTYIYHDEVRRDELME